MGATSVDGCTKGTGIVIFSHINKIMPTGFKADVAPVPPFEALKWMGLVGSEVLVRSAKTHQAVDEWVVAGDIGSGEG